MLEVPKLGGSTSPKHIAPLPASLLCPVCGLAGASRVRHESGGQSTVCTKPAVKSATTVG